MSVTTSRKPDPPVVCTVSTAALAEDRVVETATGQKLVGSGRLLDKTQVVIVHPETLTRCPPSQIGEIWVASAGVARGYWQRRDATKETFAAYLTDTGEGPFLRTGDLGFIHQGELFVTGRLKDLIIIHGENHYPQDIEWVVEQSHPALRPGYGAAFAINIDGVEQLVMAFEVERKAVKNLNTEEVVNAIRIGIAEQCELSVYSIVLLKRGSILKTSSGKIQRQACRKAFLEGSLESVASWTITALLKPSGDNLGGFSELKDQQRHSRAELAPAQAWGGNPLNRYKTLSNQLSNTPDNTEPDSPQNETEKRLVEIWQRVLGIESINRKDNFFELRGDSLKAAVVVSEIEKAFGLHIPVESVAAAKTIEKLADQITRNYWDTIGSRCLVPANPQGRKRPFFYVHAIGGRGSAFMLARYLDPERPVYGLQAVGLDGKTAPYTHIQDMVEHYIQEIQTVQPHGSYLLGGQCIGGNIALEMAQQLKQRGEQVLLVAMSDSPNPLITTEQKNQQWTHWKLYGKAHKREKFKKQGLTDNLIDNILKVSEANWQVIISHCPKIYSGRVVHFSAVENRQQPNRSMFDPMQPNGWNQFVAVGIEIIEVPGRHGTYHAEPHVQVLAAKLNACLEQVESEVQAQSTAIPILSH